MTTARKRKPTASQLAKEIKETIKSNEERVEGEKMEGMKILNSVEERLQDALSIDNSKFVEEIGTKDGNVVEVTKKVYQFATPIGKRSQITVYDRSIIESTEKINAALHGRSILNYVICKEFSNIAESGKLENMGFKNVAEYGKAVFGLETSTVNHYARIGHNFINDDYSVKAGLPELTTGHFIELNTLVGENGEVDEIVELYATGVLVDGMSTKAVREKIKQLRNPALEDNAEKSGESPKSEQSSNANVATKGSAKTEETPTEELEAEFDKQVVIGQIIASCTRINELFSILKTNEIDAVGYSEHVDAIKELAKTLV